MIWCLTGFGILCGCPLKSSLFIFEILIVANLTFFFGFMKIEKGYYFVRTLLCDALAIWYHLHNSKKREKHPWGSITFSKVAGLSLQLQHGCFSRFLNCTNYTKLRKASLNMNHKKSVLIEILKNNRSVLGVIKWRSFY